MAYELNGNIIIYLFTIVINIFIQSPATANEFNMSIYSYAQLVDSHFTENDQKEISVTLEYQDGFLKSFHEVENVIVLYKNDKSNKIKTGCMEIEEHKKGLFFYNYSNYQTWKYHKELEGNIVIIAYIIIDMRGNITLYYLGNDNNVLNLNNIFYDIIQNNYKLFNVFNNYSAYYVSKISSDIIQFEIITKNSLSSYDNIQFELFNGESGDNIVHKYAYIIPLKSKDINITTNKSVEYTQNIIDERSVFKNRKKMMKQQAIIKIDEKNNLINIALKREELKAIMNYERLIFSSIITKHDKKEYYANFLTVIMSDEVHGGY